MTHHPPRPLVASRIATGVRDIAADLGGDQVATVGRFEVHPDLVNVVAQRVTLTVDLRNTDEARLREAERRFTELVATAAGNEGVSVDRRTLARFEPVDFDPAMVDRVERVARELGHSTRRLPSGAGHDAQMLARVCPTAMVFTPSVDGLSHNIAEYTEPADIAAGADVLFNVLIECAGGSR